jgi:hypothetical protein
MSTHSGYACNSCAKIYTHKYNYDRHVVCCEFFNKTLHQHEYAAESHEAPPDIHSLYQLVKELALRVTKVEKENVQLKQQLAKRNKVNILDVLNKLPMEKQPTQPFIRWLQYALLPNVHLHLDTVYSNDLISGIVATWTLALSKLDGDAPIKAFENRPNTFYIYELNEDGNNIWCVLTANVLDKHLRHVCKQFVVDFKVHWYDKHIEQIKEDEKWTNMYVDYYQKILGGTRYTTDGICQKVRQQLYTAIKTPFSQTVDIDFT